MNSDYVCVDTDALSDGQAGVTETVARLQQYTQFMKSKLQAVNDRFAGRNYDRIESALTEASAALNSIYEQIDATVLYLKSLESCVDTYSQYKY